MTKVLAGTNDGALMREKLRGEFLSGNSLTQAEMDKRTAAENAIFYKKVDDATGRLAKIVGYDLLVQEAVYLDPGVDITADLIKFMNGDSDIKFVAKEANIAIVNTDRLFQSFSSEPREAFIIRADKALSDLAKKNNIQIVFQFQSVGFFSTSVDITTDLIANLSQNSSKMAVPASQNSNAQEKCLDLGFKANSDGMKKCLAQFSK
jgi:Skp family chaperone for outer membrane proteins